MPLDEWAKARGSYILLIRLPRDKIIRVGCLGALSFSAGYYGYVGSAMSGLKSRLNRHLRRDKRVHWHIDYLLEEAVISGIIVARAEERTECLIARALSGEFSIVSGFGASDCSCPSHLFWATEDMKQVIMTTISGLVEASSLPSVLL